MQELYTWGFRGAISFLFIVLWFWTKRWVNQQDGRWEKHDRDREEERGAWASSGGLVTREQYYMWCHKQRDACPGNLGMKNLQAWRDNMLEKGGVMLKVDGKEIIKEVTEKFCERVDEMFEHHREWVGQEMKLIRMEITKVSQK